MGNPTPTTMRSRLSAAIERFLIRHRILATEAEAAYEIAARAEYDRRTRPNLNAQGADMKQPMRVVSRDFPAKTAHPVYPGGPPCNPHCEGEWSTYHDGYSDGYAAAIAARPETDVEAQRDMRSAARAAYSFLNMSRCEDCRLPWPTGYVHECKREVPVIDPRDGGRNDR